MTEELKNTFEELKASIRAISAKVDKMTEEEEKDTELLELVRDYYRRKEEREKQLAYEELNCYTETLKGWEGEE